MSDENIFSGVTPPKEEVVTPPTDFQIPTEVSELVGEGKKYKTAEEALKAMPHAQKHIQTIEVENAKLKEELSKRKAVEEVLEEFKASAVQPSKEGTPPVQLDEAKIAQMVSTVVEQKEKQKKATQNTQAVIEKLTEKFGEKAEEVYIKLANDNSLSIPMLNALSAASPDAVLKLAGITVPPPVPLSKPNSNINTDALNNNKPQEVSARVGFKATTKDMVAAWKAAGEKIKQSA